MHPELRRTLTLEHASAEQIDNYNMHQAFELFKRHDRDVGSIELQGKYQKEEKDDQSN